MPRRNRNAVKTRHTRKAHKRKPAQPRNDRLHQYARVTGRLT